MRLLPTAAILLAATLSVGATKQSADWGATVSVTPSGTHVIGNPAAKVRITEFLSYTCPHCATFHKESEGPLRIAYVPAGKVSIEVRHIIRDPVDLAAAMLSNCVEANKFYRIHNAILQQQPKWIGLFGKASDAQKQRWSNGTVAQRLQAIASDFGFYAIMDGAGYGRAATDQCLANEATAKKLLDQTDEALNSGVKGTPSFMLNGKLLDEVHDWAGLEASLKKVI